MDRQRLLALFSLEKIQGVLSMWIIPDGATGEDGMRLSCAQLQDEKQWV